MADPAAFLLVGAAGIAGISIASAAVLKGWSGWLNLKRHEMTEHPEAAPPPSAAARIEMADLKERVRRLEAIANGIDI